MSDNERDLDGLSEEEQKLSQRLAELGGLMNQLQQIEPDIDEAFARTLRAHLVHGEELAPHPTFARRLRTHLTRRTGARPVRRPRRRILSWLAALAVIAAVITTVLFNVHRAASFRAPYPTRADLLFNLPSPAGVGSHLAPTLSLVHRASAAPYMGPVRFTPPRLPQPSSPMRAYQLASGPGVAARSRRLFGIRSAVRRVVGGGAVWLVAADGGISSRRPLHSLAVSVTTGELIYHDRRNYRLPKAKRALTRGVAIDVARHWLTQLGWPGGLMPLQSIGNAPGLPKVRQIVLGWRGLGRTTIPEATLWVAPDRSVIEAWVWPQVAESGSVSTRSVVEAWSDVLSRRAPLVIQGVDPSIRQTATATLRRVRVVLILVPGSHGAPFLVPAYRFDGIARVGETVQGRAWSSLAPDAQR